MTANRFANLKYKDFQRMAQDHSLSRYEKIGFPDDYRKGKEEQIFQDILTKLPRLEETHQVVLDIGPGCSDLPHLMIEHCRKKHHTLILIDSAEMLSLLPDEPFIRKIPGYYPRCPEIFEEYQEKINVILTYSVLQHIFMESNVWEFLDGSLELLADGGQMLIGDIPNISKRKRFFSSPNGVQFHQAFTQTQTIPEVRFNQIERHQIDDTVLLGLVSRARNQGVDAYLVPQGKDLPMENRREDMLIRKP